MFKKRFHLIERVLIGTSLWGSTHHTTASIPNEQGNNYRALKSIVRRFWTTYNSSIEIFWDLSSCEMFGKAYELALVGTSYLQFFIIYFLQRPKEKEGGDRGKGRGYQEE